MTPSDCSYILDAIMRRYSLLRVGLERPEGVEDRILRRPAWGGATVYQWQVTLMPRLGEAHVTGGVRQFAVLRTSGCGWHDRLVDDICDAIKKVAGS